MPCCLGVIAVVFPRLALALMWIMGYTAYSFETRLWPILGFFIMPFTTCAYALAMQVSGGVKGLGLLLVIAGVLLDFGGHGAEARSGYRAMHTKRGW